MTDLPDDPLPRWEKIKIVLLSVAISVAMTGAVVYFAIRVQ